MNDLIMKNKQGQAVTTSLAVADGTGNEHRAVLQLIRTHLADFEDFGRVAFEMRPFETLGGTQQREVAILNEHQSTLLITFMRNSEVVKAFKKRLVKAFFEYATQARTPAIDPMQVLNDPAAMRGLLLGYTEKVIALEEKVSVLTPKADALDLLATADGCVNPTVAAKTLQVRPKDLFDYLRSSKWIYKRAGGRNDVAYQDKIQRGLLTHKIHTVHLDDGTDKMREQVLITPKGLSLLAGVFSAREMRAA